MKNKYLLGMAIFILAILMMFGEVGVAAIFIAGITIIPAISLINEYPKVGIFWGKIIILMVISQALFFFATILPWIVVDNNIPTDIIQAITLVPVTGGLYGYLILYKVFEKKDKE